MTQVKSILMTLSDCPTLSDSVCHAEVKSIFDDSSQVKKVPECAHSHHHTCLAKYHFRGSKLTHTITGCLESGVEPSGANTLSLRQSSELGSIGGLERVEHVRQRGEGDRRRLGHESGHSVARIHPLSNGSAGRGGRHRWSPIGG